MTPLFTIIFMATLLGTQSSRARVTSLIPVIAGVALAYVYYNQAFPCEVVHLTYPVGHMATMTSLSVAYFSLFSARCLLHSKQYSPMCSNLPPVRNVFSGTAFIHLIC